MSKQQSSGGCGCLTTIVVLVVMWALVFGVNVNGKHYGISGCGCDGVQFDTGAP